MKVNRGRFSKRRQPKRRARGETHGAHKLTASDVRDIRAGTDYTCTEWAEELGVSIAAVSQARRRKTWKHVK